MPETKNKENIYGGYEVYSLVDSNRYNDEYGAVIDELGEKEILYIRKKLKEQKTPPEELSEEQEVKVKARVDILVQLLCR